MNTEWWGLYIPGLEEKYGKKKVQLVVSSSSLPLVKSQESKGVKGQVELLIDF